MPEVDSGCFAPYTQYRVTNYVAGGVGKVELVVTSIPDEHADCRGERV